MARPAGVKGADTMRAIPRAAIRRIARDGFEAMNLRELAADVNLRVGSLYNHVPQKQEFLADLLEGIMLELLQDLRQRMAGLADPTERLLQFVRFHIEWHTARKDETFIGNMELRSLSPQQYQRVTTLALLTGISAWYREDGRLSQAKLIRVYQGLALRLVGLGDAPPARRRRPA